MPLKAQLLDVDGNPVTDAELMSTLPLLQVIYSPATGGVSVDVTDDALAVGKGTDGNEFYFDYTGSKWQYNLMTKNYTAPGTYTMTMTAGDGYVISPTCEAIFEIEQ